MRLAAGLACVVAVAAADRPVEGNPASPVRVMIYEDLQCSDCAAFRKMLDAGLLAKYGSKAAFEHRDFPLPKHDWSRRAAIVGRHLHSVKPELGIRFRQWVFTNQASITAANFDAKLGEFAKSAGADLTAARAAVHDTAIAKLVDADYQEGIARGVAKTPSVFVDGEPFIETFTAAEISKALDAAIAAAGGKQ